MKITGENFIGQMQLKNEAALIYFIDHYGWIIQSVVHKKMAAYPNEQEACMNDIFLAIWQNIGDYDQKLAGFKTWVSAVARYQVLKYIRDMHVREMADIEEIEIPGETDVQSRLFTEAEKEDFQELLDGLTPEDQKIFMKLFWEEMSYEDVGKSMNMPVDRVYSRVSRGKKKLRNRRVRLGGLK